MGDSHPTPPRFSLISEADQAEYKQLQYIWHSGHPKYKRNLSMDCFRTILDTILRFTQGTAHCGHTRGVVCGLILVSKNEILVNTRLLSQMVGRVKSVMNMYLDKSGYAIDRKNARALEMIRDIIPDMSSSEARHWRIRRRRMPRLPRAVDDVVAVKDISTRFACFAQADIATIEEWCFNECS